jgi:hypothetical protein
LSISGVGDVAADVSWSNSEEHGGWSPLADSFFDVFFHVDATGPFSLDAAVSWLGDDHPALNGGAQVKLRDVTNSIDLFLVNQSSSPPGANDPPAAPIVLILDNSYELSARATIIGGGPVDGLFEADGHWSVTLTAIPEVGSLLLMSPIVLGAAFCAWRSSRRRQR